MTSRAPAASPSACTKARWSWLGPPAGERQNAYGRLLACRAKPVGPSPLWATWSAEVPRHGRSFAEAATRNPLTMKKHGPLAALAATFLCASTAGAASYNFEVLYSGGGVAALA